MLGAGGHDSTISLEACKFWLSLGRNPFVCKELLSPPHLDRLLSVLLKGMRYIEEEENKSISPDDTDMEFDLDKEDEEDLSFTIEDTDSIDSDSSITSIST